MNTLQNALKQELLQADSKTVKAKNRRTQNKYTALSKNLKIFVADFETTTDKDNCYAWSCAIVELGDENVKIYSNIKDFMNFCLNQNEDTVIYFHNIKFDGTFIIDFILRNTHYKSLTNESQSGVPLKDMRKGQFQYVISDMGQWYKITFRTSKVFIEFRDSFKLFPMGLDILGKSFNVKHQKTTMDYTNKKSLSDCNEKDIEYIKNDVLCLSECLQEYQKLYELSHLTIGSACVAEYKKIVKDTNLVFFKKIKFKEIFQELEQYEMDSTYYGVTDVEQFVRKTYKGAFCYVNPEFANKEIIINGVVLDVNSLYPFAMREREYPIKEPKLFKGTLHENNLDLYDKQYYYFIHLKINGVKLNKGKLPTFQIKNDFRFRRNEWITEINTSDDIDVYFTMTDYQLFTENYTCKKLIECGGVYFHKCAGLFNDYIDKHMKVKMTSKHAKRNISKLYLNNLYGKFSASRECDYKYLSLENDKLVYHTVTNPEKKPSLSIAVGSAITAYAREYIIRNAQANIKHFAYCDTDSLHLLCNIDDVIGLNVDDNKLGYFACEGKFQKAKYIRQKTYAEIDNGKIMLTACGMNPTCKAKVRELIKTDGLQAFNHNLIIEGGKLRPVLTKGGTVLVESPFTLR